MDKLTFKVLLLGDGATGKTSVVRRFVHEKFAKEYLETIGMEPYTQYESIDGTEVSFSVWDIAARENFKPLRNFFYKGAKGALIVVDLTRKETLENVGNWVEEALSFAQDQFFILVGNKSDLTDQIEISDAELQKAADDLPQCIGYIKTSALTGVNVKDAFISLGRRIKKKVLTLSLIHI